MEDFTSKDFEPDGVFGSRGIKEKVAAGAFHKYALSERVDTEAVFNGDAVPWRSLDRGLVFALALTIGKYAGRCTRLAEKAPGMIMRRFPVPFSNWLIFNEQRPDWPVWTGDPMFPVWMNGTPEPHRHTRVRQEDGSFVGVFPANDPDARVGHVGRSRDTFEGVCKATGPDELDALVDADGWNPVNRGADHFGQDTEEPHLHVKIAKYVFTPNVTGWVVDPDGPFDHAAYRTEEGRVRHETFHHAPSGEAQDGTTRSWNSEVNTVEREYPHPPTVANLLDRSFRWPEQVDITGKHKHYREEDVTHYAARLSWHPYKREERWQRDRVMFALEGCLKEAALVSAGEATFSCPSVTLWGAPELRPFAEQHLRGKVVYVVVDSDWNPAVRRLRDDTVIRQALLVRDTLIRYGVDARVAAPPQPEEAGCTDPTHDKHGVDDHLGPCSPLGVDDLLEITVTPRCDLREWLTEQRAGQRGQWRAGVKNDLEVLTWLSRYTANGRCGVSLRDIARHIQHALDAPAVDDEPVFEQKGV